MKIILEGYNTKFENEIFTQDQIRTPILDTSEIRHFKRIKIKEVEVISVVSLNRYKTPSEEQIMNNLKQRVSKIKEAASALVIDSNNNFDHLDEKIIDLGREFILGFLNNNPEIINDVLGKINNKSEKEYLNISNGYIPREYLRSYLATGGSIRTIEDIEKRLSDHLLSACGYGYNLHLGILFNGNLIEKSRVKDLSKNKKLETDEVKINRLLAEEYTNELIDKIYCAVNKKNFYELKDISDKFIDHLAIKAVIELKEKYPIINNVISIRRN